jgi:hypothetical protein
MKILTTILFAALLATRTIASDDPFVGKWILDIERSEYPAGSCPKAMVIEMGTVGHGVRYKSDTVYANGKTVHSEYTADYDGNQAIVMGTHGMMLPVFLKRIDSNTVVASYTKSLQVVAISRRVVSEDKRFMTVTTTSKDSSGKSVTTIGVYKRE